MKKKYQHSTTDEKHTADKRAFKIKEALGQLNEGIAGLIARLSAELEDEAFHEWSKTCSGITKQLDDELIRVGVVGPIKSGKSTFVNALLKGDYLKRGAGVVTSMVTRVQKGKRLAADLLLKDWDEINADIRRALILLPFKKSESSDEPFDIRQETMRELLLDTIAALDTDIKITGDTHNINILLMKNYINGYERVQHIVSTSPTKVCFTGAEFEQYKEFAADDSLSVYLKDLLLTIDTDGIDSGLELADCQGSDSPNPMHLSMIENYLFETGYIIYVISSRTGLRRADITFLDIIIKMGIADRLIFVVNVDFNEHENITDLHSLLHKIKDDLSFLPQQPELYAFSSLYLLFCYTTEKLPEKDRIRYQSWKQDASLMNFSETQTAKFMECFQHKLAQERFFVFYEDSVRRLITLASGIHQRLILHRDLISGNTQTAERTIEKISKRRGETEKIKSMITNSIQGAIKDLKQQLAKNTDRLFDPQTGLIMTKLNSFIQSLTLNHELLVNDSGGLDFMEAMYLAFQAMKQALERYMAEIIHPDIMHFVREQESLIESELNTVKKAYETIIRDVIISVDQSTQTPDNSLLDVQAMGKFKLKLSSVKTTGKFTIPSLASPMHFSVRVKTEAMFNAGLHSIAAFFMKLFNINSVPADKGKIKGVNKGIQRVKQETIQSIIHHYRDYKENLKYQYLFKLTDTAAEQLQQDMFEGFRFLSADMSLISAKIDKKQTDRNQRIALLTSETHTILQYIERLNELICNQDRLSLNSENQFDI